MQVYLLFRSHYSLLILQVNPALVHHIRCHHHLNSSAHGLLYSERYCPCGSVFMCMYLQFSCFFTSGKTVRQHCHSFICIWFWLSCNLGRWELVFVFLLDPCQISYLKSTGTWGRTSMREFCLQSFMKHSKLWLLNTMPVSWSHRERYCFMCLDTFSR